MPTAARTMQHHPLEALIRKQIAWRDVTHDLRQGGNTSFQKRDASRAVNGSFTSLVQFLRQVAEAESYRQSPPQAECQPSARP